MIHGKLEKEMSIDNFRNFEPTHGVERIRALAEWGRLEEALNVADACIALQENMDNARFNRGAVLMRMGRYASAIEDFTHVVNYKNENKRPSDYIEEALYSRGYCNLALGKLEGFIEYEPRRHHLMLLPEGPHYDGSQDLQGKTLLIIGENTLSENLLFSRYISHVKSDTVLAMPPAGQVLFQHVLGIRLAVHVVPPFDYWCTLMSLAVTQFIREIPPPPTFCLPLDNTLRWHSTSKSRKIGLCWSGPECRGAMPLELFSPLFDIKGIELYGFQDEIAASDSAAFDRLDIWNMGTKFKTFTDAACALKGMDLLITVDNAIAHLAGTLNIPCWVLLPKHMTHWVWGSNKDACLWYPSVCIFRQFNEGDWTSVVERVNKALVEFCQL